jgi:hypothetical protein
MNERPIRGALYRHYKGGLYRVLQLAKHSETLETLVVYANEHDPTLVWARPISMWNETVSTKDGDVLRFTLLEE